LKKISEYHEHAAECRKMANRAKEPNQKAMLAKMAATWENLAREREAHMARQKRLAILEKAGANDKKTKCRQNSTF